MLNHLIAILVILTATDSLASDPAYRPYLDCTLVSPAPDSLQSFDTDVVVTEKGAYVAVVKYTYTLGSRLVRVSSRFPSVRLDDEDKGMTLFSADYDPSGNGYGTDLLLLQDEYSPDGGMKAKLLYKLPPKNGLPGGLFGELWFSCGWAAIGK